VDQVCLDQLTAARLERGPHTDADSSRNAAVRKARVYPVPRTHERLLGYQVGCGKPQLAPALVAVDHFPAKLKRGSEKARGAGDLAREHQAANMAGGDDLPIDLQQRMHGRLEARIAGEQQRVALSLVTEAEVLA